MLTLHYARRQMIPPRFAFSGTTPLFRPTAPIYQASVFARQWIDAREQAARAGCIVNCEGADPALGRAEEMRAIELTKSGIGAAQGPASAEHPLWNLQAQSILAPRSG
jgi:hypothetical protein